MREPEIDNSQSLQLLRISGALASEAAGKLIGFIP